MPSTIDKPIFFIEFASFRLNPSAILASWQGHHVDKSRLLQSRARPRLTNSHSWAMKRNSRDMIAAHRCAKHVNLEVDAVYKLKSVISILTLISVGCVTPAIAQAPDEMQSNPCPPPDFKGKGPPADRGAPPPGLGQKPDGPPPGPPPGGGACGGPGGAQRAQLGGAFAVDKPVIPLQTNKHYASHTSDISAVYVNGAGRLHLVNPDIEKSGDSSSRDNSSFYGLNAAVLIAHGGVLSIKNGHIRSDGVGANAVSSVGEKSFAELAGSTIVASGNGAHGVDVSGGGAILLRNVVIETSGASAAAVATDRGGGTVTVVGGRFSASGYRSPGIYSTGTIRVRDAEIHAAGAEAAVIEGSNSIEISNSALTADKSWGVMLYQSFSGDAKGQHSRFTQHGGSLRAAEGPLFYVNNATGEITLDGVAVNVRAGIIVRAAADQWGVKGHNAGHAILTVRHQHLPGDLVAQDGGSVVASLNEGSVLIGRTQNASLAFDAGSRWDVTGNSGVEALTIEGESVADKLNHIRSNGHQVTYDVRLPENGWLGGKSWPLEGGGGLHPVAGTAKPQ